MTHPRTSHRLVLDRREGEYAVVELENGATLDLPGWMIPPDARDGDVLIARAGHGPERGWRVDLAVDAEATAEARRAARARLERLAEHDPGGDLLR
jgi:hypothetical protein